MFARLWPLQLGSVCGAFGALCVSSGSGLRLSSVNGSLGSVALGFPGCRLGVCTRWYWPPGSGSDCCDCSRVPSIFHRYSVYRSDTDRLPARQHDDVLARAGKYSDPCASDTPLGQLSLPFLHLSVGAGLLERQFAHYLLAKLRDDAIPRASREPPPGRETIVAHLVSGEHEGGVPNQPAHYRQLQVQPQPQSCLQRQHEPPHYAHNILDSLLGASV